jgi:lipoprotein NlpD
MGELNVKSCQSRVWADRVNIFPARNGLLLLAAALLLVMIALSASSYASPSKTASAKGVYHRVKNGETLIGIARAYGIPVQTIADANRLKMTERIEKDRILFIPGAKRVIDNTTPLGLAKRDKQKAPSGKSDPKERQKGKTLTKKEELPEKKAVRREVKGKKKEEGEQEEEIKERKKSLLKDKPASDTKRTKLKEKDDLQPKDLRLKSNADDAKALPPGGRRFIWPVKGRVVSKYGLQPGGMFYNGVRIVGHPDRPVVAVAPGVVIYSAELKDYGETVIIKHAGQFATVYTHLSERTVN